MKTMTLFTAVTAFIVLVNSPLFSQNVQPSVADTSSFEFPPVIDSANISKKLTLGIGTTLNPLFQNNDIYSIARLYISISPTLASNKQKMRWEFEYGYKSSKTLELQPTLIQRSSGLYDTVTLETSAQTTINRIGLGFVYHLDEVMPNVFMGFGFRGGAMSLNSNKNIKERGERKFENLQMFFEPIIEIEYIYERKFGISIQTFYTAFTPYDSNVSRYSGSALVPMSVEPLSSKMNLLLNVHWYFMKK